MVNYFSKFSARLSELAEPIRELSKCKVSFNWGPEDQEAFNQMKREIVRAPILSYYIYLYIYFILETDQKPLEAILSKGLNQATPRLQRILIRIFPYNFTVHYIPGATNQLTDYLSRLGDQKDTIKLPKLYVYQIIQQLCCKK